MESLFCFAFVIVTNTTHKLFSLSCLIYLFFSPRFEPVGVPLSVHVYFYDDRFQGYLVRQEVQAVESKARETLEMWAVPQATLVLEKNLKEFERLKNLEVSTLWGFFFFLYKLSRSRKLQHEEDFLADI